LQQEVPLRRRGAKKDQNINFYGESIDEGEMEANDGLDSKGSCESCGRGELKEAERDPPRNQANMGSRRPRVRRCKNGVKIEPGSPHQRRRGEHCLGGPTAGMYRRTLKMDQEGKGTSSSKSFPATRGDTSRPALVYNARRGGDTEQHPENKIVRKGSKEVLYRSTEFDLGEHDRKSSISEKEVVRGSFIENHNSPSWIGRKKCFDGGLSENLSIMRSRKKLFLKWEVAITSMV